MLRLALTMSVAALALAACGKKDAAATGEAAPTAAKASGVNLGATPKRKPGLWTQSMTADGTTQVTKLCLDAAAEDKLAMVGGSISKDICSESSMTPKIGGGWTYSSVCKVGDGTTTSTGTITGDFNSAYKMEAKSVTVGSSMAQANGPHEMMVEAKWEGPCPADYKPGDMALPNGMKVNMLEMSGMTAAK